MIYSLKEQAEASLYEFFKQAWHVIEGNHELIPEWHLEIIAEHLEAIYYRKIKNLLVNIPPRTCKTSLISIAFPAWVWLHNPMEKFLCASCSNHLSLEIADKSRLLIESAWYQDNWGKLFKLRRDQNSKGYFANDKTGCRISTSVGSHIVGRGGSIQITDDPNTPGGESELIRDSVNNWWSSRWFNRLNDIKNDRRILVQQRTDEKDISGVILSNNDDEWYKLILPMEYESQRTISTIPLFGSKIPWKDPRKIDGELLSKRLTQKEIKKLKKELGSYQYAGQYQQRPAPLEGGLIKKQWFKLYKHKELPQLEYIIQSWDTALTANDNSNYSACTTWGVYLDRNDNQNVILLSCWRDKLEYPELRERVQRLAKDYRDVGNVKLSINDKYIPDLILIEAKASGDPLIQDLNRAGIYTRPFIPNKHGDKIQRVKLITALIECGIVWVPCDINNIEKIDDFADEFLTTISYFPNVSSRDYVDSMTQALIVLRDSNRITHSRDYYEPEDEYKETTRFY